MNAPTWSCYCMQSAGVPRWMTQTVCWSWWRRMFKQVLRNGYLEACQRQKSAMETFARLPGYRVACLLFGHCQSPQTHPRLPRRKRSVFFRSLWIGLEQRVGWFTTPLTLAVPGLPIGGQEQQQRLLEHCIASCRVTILPLCSRWSSGAFPSPSCAPDGMPVCDVSMWSWVATELAQTATQFKYQMDWRELPLGWAPESIPSPRPTRGVAGFSCTSLQARHVASSHRSSQADWKTVLVHGRGAVVKAVYVLLVPLPHEATDGAAESGCRSKGGVASLLGYSVSCARTVQFIRCTARVDSDGGGGAEGEQRGCFAVRRVQEWPGLVQTWGPRFAAHKGWSTVGKVFPRSDCSRGASALSVIMEAGCCSGSRCLCRWCQSGAGRLVVAFKFTTLPWKHLLFFHTATTFWFTCLVFVWRKGGFTEVYLCLRSAGPACPARMPAAIRRAGRSWLDCNEAVVWQHRVFSSTHRSLAVICGKAPCATAYFSRLREQEMSGLTGCDVVLKLS